ncbi:MAG: CHC2 zinc finger domain-containing protein [Clostridia bacterium]|nr:CHC2 zinc finger domain-containing protein [Clostridia bacterium]
MGKYSNRLRVKKTPWYLKPGKFTKKELSLFMKGIKNDYKIFNKYYTDEEIDEIMKSNRLVDVIAEYQEVYKSRTGEGVHAICTFHSEKTPSMSLFKASDRELYNCLGCGAVGNVFDFIKRIENLNFRRAVTLLETRVLHLGYLEKELGVYSYKEHKERLPFNAVGWDSNFQKLAIGRKIENLKPKLEKIKTEENDYERAMDEGKMSELFYTQTRNIHLVNFFDYIKPKMRTAESDIQEHLETWEFSESIDINNSGDTQYDFYDTEDLVEFEKAKNNFER